MYILLVESQCIESNRLQLLWTAYVKQSLSTLNVMHSSVVVSIVLYGQFTVVYTVYFVHWVVSCVNCTVCTIHCSVHRVKCFQAKPYLKKQTVSCEVLWQMALLFQVSCILDGTNILTQISLLHQGILKSGGCRPWHWPHGLNRGDEISYYTE